MLLQIRFNENSKIGNIVDSLRREYKLLLKKLENPIILEIKSHKYIGSL